MRVVVVEGVVYKEVVWEERLCEEVMYDSCCV